MKKVLKVVLYILAVLAGAFVLLLLVATVTDFKPGFRENVYQAESPELLPEWTEYDLMIWNIGYCGLNAEMDFFYDGGRMVRPPKEKVLENLGAVREFIRSNDSIEFYLLQEVDKKSRRSYRLNMYDSICLDLPNYYPAFGVNYKVFFVPLPPSNPMGNVLSGIQTLSRYRPARSDRYSFPGNYSWPMGVFMLDRCFLVNRYPVAGGKELILINTHNSAYDDGSLRAAQMNFMKNFLLKEYAKGNYVVVGGDWNQTPFGFSGSFDDQVFDKVDFTPIEENYPEPGWIWAWDGSTPTNRRVSTAYQRGVTPTTLIDCFLLSPNVQPVQLKTIDLDFRNSDHNPVVLKILIKNNIEKL